MKPIRKLKILKFYRTNVLMCNYTLNRSKRSTYHPYVNKLFLKTMKRIKEKKRAMLKKAAKRLLREKIPMPSQPINLAVIFSLGSVDESGAGIVGNLWGASKTLSLLNIAKRIMKSLFPHCTVFPFTQDNLTDSSFLGNLFKVLRIDGQTLRSLIPLYEMLHGAESGIENMNSAQPVDSPSGSITDSLPGQDTDLSHLLVTQMVETNEFQTSNFPSSESLESVFTEVTAENNSSQASDISTLESMDTNNYNDNETSFLHPGNENNTLSNQQEITEPISSERVAETNNEVSQNIDNISSLPTGANSSYFNSEDGTSTNTFALVDTQKYEQLGINIEKPKRSEFAPKFQRDETFSSWPQKHFIKPEDLSAAGFYFNGQGDRVRCFYCGGGLRNWEEGDDVWVEHARWFPKCAFLKQVTGQLFIDTVQDLKINNKVTLEMVRAKMGHLPLCLDEKINLISLKQDPAVLAALTLGYKEEDVMKVALALRKNENVLSSDKLISKLAEDQKVQCQSHVCVSKAEVAPDTSECSASKIKEKNSQLRQQLICKICMDKDVEIVFLPCGHLVSCFECASALKDCPVCRKFVKGTVRAFLS